jgi:hypothetical protein
MRSHLLDSLLVLPLFLLATALSLASADDMLQLVLVGPNGSEPALERAEADTLAILTRFAEEEGPSYQHLFPGQSVSASGDRVRHRRALRAAYALPQQQKERELPVVGCPPGCSKSGSVACKALGCVYCGKCGRRERQRRGRRRRNLQGGSRQRLVENFLSRYLTQYCEKEPGCFIQARIKRVEANGTITRAT